MRKLDLGEGEIKVYLCLLGSGTGYANRISAQTGMNRTNVYEALDRLVAKGIVCFITKNKVKLFEPRAPEALMLLVDEKENEIRKIRADTLRAVEELRQEASKPKQALEAGIYSGKKGIRSLFEEMLRAKKPLSFLAADLQFRYFFGPYFLQWHKRRAALNISQRTIFPETVRSKVWPMDLWQRKFVEREYTSPTTTIIYGDTCIFVQWSGEPFAIKITNAPIAKSHMNYFNMLWKGAKQ